MIMAGPEVPRGVLCTRPVSLVDGFPTILDCVGLTPEATLPGAPLLDAYVSPTYCVTCGNDGHSWGVDAFSSIQNAITSGANRVFHT